MKKKLLALLGAVASLALFAGCGEKECAHTYDNACDVTCNDCGETRVVEDHVYDNACDTDCNVCGDERTASDHVYDNACDASCNVCGDESTPAAHVYDNACDTSCNVCGDERTPADHVYDNACDASCNVCGDERTPADHVYDNACDTDCNVCGDERTASDHVYDNACDASCNVCGDERTPAAHVYDNACDTSCNVCGDTREVTHDFALQSAYEATKFYFWGGEVALVAGTKAFGTLGADKTYGYMPAMDVTVSFDELTGYSMTTSANIAYTFEQVSMSEFTIQAPDGRYLYMKGTYDSFNLATELPEEGGTWTIELNSATGEATIRNVLTNKWIQYSSSYGTYGVYNTQKGTLPMIYCYNGAKYESDENGHWTLCSICGTADEAIPHSGGTANCTSKAYCEVCDTPYGELGDHTFESGWISCDDTQHWIECDYCNAKKEGTVADHTYDYACSSACNFDGCWGTREPAAHTYDQEKFDETNHWNECVCGAIDEDSVLPHDMGWFSTAETHVKGCDDCNYEDESSRVAHTPQSDEWTIEEDVHYMLCECGWGINDAAHTYEKVSENGVDTMTCICGDSYTFNTAVTAERVEFAVSATDVAIATTGASEYESIVSIKLGNYDLGTSLDALVISSDLAADKAAHGEQNVIVTVKDAKGNEHALEVPVLLVTAYIASTDDFYDAFLMPTTQTAYYGYYAMTANIGTDNMGGGQPWWFAAATAANDVTLGNGTVLTAKMLGRRGCAAQEGEHYGFRGTFDGRGFTIKGAAGDGGLFTGIGKGALIKDVTIVDVYNNGGASKSVLAKGIYGGTIENVTIKYERAAWASGSTASLPTNPEANQSTLGWIANTSCINATFKDVTIDASGYNFYALFGSGWYSGYGYINIKAGLTPAEAPNTYENVTIKADSLRYLGYYYVGSTAWNALGEFNGVTTDGVAGITMIYTAPVANEATNEIKVETTESTTLVLDEAWADWTVADIAYNGGSLGADLTVASSNFTGDDYGNQTFVLTMTKGNATKYLNVPVAISSGKTITTVTLSDRQDVILNNGAEEVPAVSLSLGEYADGGEVVSVIYNDTYNLGKDVANLDVAALAAAPQDHGEGNVVVTINKSAEEELQVAIPVKIVTRTIRTMQEFDDYVKSQNGATAVVDGYYMLADDIAYTEVYDANGNVVPAGTAGAVAYKAKTANWGDNTGKGFVGTFDGNGKTMKVNTSVLSGGLFGLVQAGGVIKNVKIVDAWNSPAMILGRNAYGATLENVEVTISAGNDGTAETGKVALFGNIVQNITMKDVKITSSKKIAALFFKVSGGTYTNVTVMAPTVGAYSSEVAEFPTGITVTQTA